MNTYFNYLKHRLVFYSIQSSCSVVADEQSIKLLKLYSLNVLICFEFDWTQQQFYHLIKHEKTNFFVLLYFSKYFAWPTDISFIDHIDWSASPLILCFINKGFKEYSITMATILIFLFTYQNCGFYGNKYNKNMSVVKLKRLQYKRVALFLFVSSLYVNILYSHLYFTTWMLSYAYSTDITLIFYLIV